MLMMRLRRMSRRLPTAGLLALLAFPSWGARERAQTVPVGERLPDTVLEGLNGPPRRLIEFRGRPLLINVWASWCGPCRAEMASLERLAWTDERGDFAIIGISTDDDAEQARAWLGRSHATILHFIDRDLEMETLLGASRLPLTVLVSSDGRVLRKVSGARDWDSREMRSLIASTLR